MAGERLYVGTGSHVLEDTHRDRYEFARERIGFGCTVLDAACGSGYGSDILARRAARVIGLDVSDEALDFARDHYEHSNIQFARADLSQRIDLPDASCDCVVSFETLEHVADQRRMLGEFRRVLRPNGLLIISTPDREIITEKAHEVNEFHIAELSKREFVDLLSEQCRLEELYGQVRYEPESWKQSVKHLARFDVLGLGRRVRSWQRTAFVDRMVAPSHRTMEAVPPDTPGEHWWLVAVAVRVT